jgi:hypothetical protein
MSERGPSEQPKQPTTTQKTNASELISGDPRDGRPIRSDNIVMLIDFAEIADYGNWGILAKNTLDQKMDEGTCEGSFE